MRLGRFTLKYEQFLDDIFYFFQEEYKKMKLYFIQSLIFYVLICINQGSALNLSVADTKACTVPGSTKLCPASGMKMSSEFFIYLCKAQADLAGAITSYLPWTITVGIWAILWISSRI